MNTFFVYLIIIHRIVEHFRNESMKYDPSGFYLFVSHHCVAVHFMF